MRLSLFARFIPALICLLCALAGAARAGVMYTGDANGVDGLANVDNGLYTQANVYQDFVVPAGKTWIVNSLFTNNGMEFTATSADWSIRSGVSAGNGGTLIASGTGPTTPVPTGRTVLGDAEFTVAVSVPNVTLGPGHYWFDVTPVGTNQPTDFSFETTTSGLNSMLVDPSFIASPFFTSSDTGDNFTPTTSLASDLTNFSGGVVFTTPAAPGPAVPEPSTLLLTTCGGLLLGLRRWRRRAAA